MIAEGSQSDVWTFIGWGHLDYENDLQLIVDLSLRLAPELFQQLLVERTMRQVEGLARWEQFCASLPAQPNVASYRELMDDEYLARR